ncbi:MAG: RDD family protein [archaeon]
MSEAERIQPTEATTNVVIARGVAQVIDYIAPILLPIAVIYTLTLAVNRVADVEWVLIPFMLVIMAYNTLLEAYWNGQTIGKRIIGIRVVDRHGADPSFKQALV